jgi:S-adenosylmethionine:tRNA ribosyltransferase-isomerase
MKVSEFRYELPERLIAQFPAEPRDESRLLVLDGGGTAPLDARFRELPRLLSQGDLLVANDTRVIPARLRGRKESGGQVELLLLEQEGPELWEALVKPARRVRPGLRVRFAAGASASVLEERGEGIYLLRIEPPPGRAARELLDEIGEVPLPRYIRRDRADPVDRERYQTLFARRERSGSAAAPTAGLHFTPRILEELRARDIALTTVTLHVGLGTFLPLRVQDAREHRMHREWYEVRAEAAAAIGGALREGRRVVAVGTTVARVLEHRGREGIERPGSGWTELFLVPGHRFEVVSGLLTNFHLPESTLLMLVCAFGGTERVLAAYRHAVREAYRFYSYGDAMLLWADG